MPVSLNAKVVGRPHWVRVLGSDTGVGSAESFKCVDGGKAWVRVVSNDVGAESFDCAQKAGRPSK